MRPWFLLKITWGISSSFIFEILNTSSFFLPFSYITMILSLNSVVLVNKAKQQGIFRSNHTLSFWYIIIVENISRSLFLTNIFLFFIKNDIGKTKPIEESWFLSCLSDFKIKAFSIFCLSFFISEKSKYSSGLIFDSSYFE